MILAGQVSSPSEEGGGIETVDVTFYYYTYLTGEKMSYFDSATSQNKVIELANQVSVDQDIKITIPKNSLVALYTTNTSSYTPYLSMPNSHSLETFGISQIGNNHSGYDNVNLYTFSQSCSISISRTCLIAGTFITLSNGTTKKVEDITYDDELLVWDFFNGCFTSAKPRWIKIKQTSPIYNKLTFSNGATLGLVGEGGTQGYHRIYNKQAGLFTHTGVPETPIGTITFAEDETEPVLIKQELINEEVDYYNIITDKHFNLFANGILTSCKCSNMYRIKDMKYVGERLMSDEEIEKDFEWREPLKLAK